jgi:hypothetical protein
MSNELQQVKWISLPAAARRISMTPNHFRQMVLHGRLPPGIAVRPVGMREWRIDVEALDEWMRNGCFTVPPGDGDGEDVA